MPVTWNRRRTLRGKRQYEEGVRHLRGVAQGSFEGALPSYKTEAERLIAVNESLNDHRKNVVIGWLGKGRCQSMEGALSRMARRIEKDNSQGRRKEHE